jgi:hypothetical protein
MRSIWILLPLFLGIPAANALEQCLKDFKYTKDQNELLSSNFSSIVESIKDQACTAEGASNQENDSLTALKKLSKEIGMVMSDNTQNRNVQIEKIKDTQKLLDWQRTIEKLHTPLLENRKLLLNETIKANTQHWKNTNPDQASQRINKKLEEFNQICREVNQEKKNIVKLLDPHDLRNTKNPPASASVSATNPVKAIKQEIAAEIKVLNKKVEPIVEGKLKQVLADDDIRFFLASSKFRDAIGLSMREGTFSHRSLTQRCFEQGIVFATYKKGFHQSTEIQKLNDLVTPDLLTTSYGQVNDSLRKERKRLAEHEKNIAQVTGRDKYLAMRELIYDSVKASPYALAKFLKNNKEKDLSNFICKSFFDVHGQEQSELMIYQMKTLGVSAAAIAASMASGGLGAPAVFAVLGLAAGAEALTTYQYVAHIKHEKNIIKSGLARQEIKPINANERLNQLEREKNTEINATAISVLGTGISLPAQALKTRHTPKTLNLAPNRFYNQSMDELSGLKTIKSDLPALKKLSSLEDDFIKMHNRLNELAQPKKNQASVKEIKKLESDLIKLNDEFIAELSRVLKEEKIENEIIKKKFSFGTNNHGIDVVKIKADQNSQFGILLKRTIPQDKQTEVTINLLENHKRWNGYYDASAQRIEIGAKSVDQLVTGEIPTIAKHELRHFLQAQARISSETPFDLIIRTKNVPLIAGYGPYSKILNSEELYNWTMDIRSLWQNMPTDPKDKLKYLDDIIKTSEKNIILSEGLLENTLWAKRTLDELKSNSNEFETLIKNTLLSDQFTFNDVMERSFTYPLSNKMRDKMKQFTDATNPKNKALLQKEILDHYESQIEQLARLANENILNQKMIIGKGKILLPIVETKANSSDLPDFLRRHIFRDRSKQLVIQNQARKAELQEFQKRLDNISKMSLKDIDITGPEPFVIIKHKNNGFVTEINDGFIYKYTMDYLSAKKGNSTFQKEKLLNYLKRATEEAIKVTEKNIEFIDLLEVNTHYIDKLDVKTALAPDISKMSKDILRKE